jgi:hypothetical protein
MVAIIKVLPLARQQVVTDDPLFGKMERVQAAPSR